VAERLGAPDERVVEGEPEEIAAEEFNEPNVLLAIDPRRAVGVKAVVWPPRTPDTWALSEDAFEYRAGMITKTEVRALALARLGPGVGDLVWDVGAHSASVAIECARLGAAAIAIERDPEACALARRNCERHGVAIEIVEGEAPAALAGLPDPDAVFIGGGGADLPEILTAAAPRARRAVVVALATVERVEAAFAALLEAGLQTEATMLQASELRPLSGGHRLAAKNPVFVVCGRRA
jgi:precorrin-6Y C5,15-methyltransferase (decarboxylating)